MYLTPHLESGDLTGAVKAARVTDPLPDVGVVDSYAGYITVDAPNDGHIFFWFFPATVSALHLYILVQYMVVR